MELTDLLGDLSTKVDDVLTTVPEVPTVDDPSLSDIPGQGSTKWLKIPNVVAVVFDLKGSTHLGTGRHDTSTARLYKSAVESAVAILNEFEAQFVDIQGDGGFGVFWGDLDFERALCAGVTIRTFSETLVSKFNNKWSDGNFPETGFKVGIASGRVLVKQLGTPRNVDEQEAVWAGKPVNYAAKAAQEADAHELIVTGSVWDHFQENDYVAFSCDCRGGASATLWGDFTIERLRDEKEKYGRRLKAGWCTACGPEFCSAIRAGVRGRDIPTQARHHLAKTQMSTALAEKAQEDRRRRSSLRSLRGK